MTVFYAKCGRVDGLTGKRETENRVTGSSPSILANKATQWALSNNNAGYRGPKFWVGRGEGRDD